MGMDSELYIEIACSKNHPWLTTWIDSLLKYNQYNEKISKEDYLVPIDARDLDEAERRALHNLELQAVCNYSSNMSDAEYDWFIAKQDQLIHFIEQGRAALKDGKSLYASTDYGL